MPKTSKTHAGFTIMELMVVIAIIGILSAVSMPNLISWRLDRHYNESLQQTFAIVNSTKTNAIKENRNAVVEFHIADREIRAFTLDENENELDRLHTYELRHGVDMENLNIAGGGNKLEFNSRGIPVGNQPSTIGLKSDRGRSNQIEISMAGRIRLQ